MAGFSFVTREADLAWRSWGNVSVIEHELGDASAITWKVMVDILASHFPGRVRSVIECVFVLISVFRTLGGLARNGVSFHARKVTRCVGLRCKEMWVHFRVYGACASGLGVSTSRSGWCACGSDDLTRLHVPPFEAKSAPDGVRPERRSAPGDCDRCCPRLC